MLKQLCKGRAEWQLQVGKPAERLSAHYQLSCDYGTAVITCWEKGGSEPLYLCENHAIELGHPHGNCLGIRTITDQTAQSNEKANQTFAGELCDLQKKNGDDRGTQIADVVEEDPVRAADRTQTWEAACTKPTDSISSEAAGRFADTKVGRATTDPSVRSPVHDLTYGNPAKAMVDEAIWNMETGNYEAYRTALRQGKSVTEAAQAAGGQLAVVHRKIIDYTLKLEARLSESGATINVREAIDRPLERVMLEIIGNGAMSDAEKGTTLEQFGAVEEWVKHGLSVEITPLEANRILRDIGDRLNWVEATRFRMH